MRIVASTVQKKRHRALRVEREVILCRSQGPEKEGQQDAKESSGETRKYAKHPELTRNMRDPVYRITVAGYDPA